MNHPIHFPAGETSSASMKRKRDSKLDMFGMGMSLTDKEGAMITIDDRPRSDGERMFLVVGRLLTAKPCKLEQFACIIMRSIGMFTGLEITNLQGDRILCRVFSGLRKGLEIINLQGDRILFRVFSEAHKQKLLDTKLLDDKFERSLLVMRDVPQNMNPLDVDLSWYSFYVHIHDLPLSMQTINTAVLVANTIGVFEEYDETATWGVSLRVRVKINIDQPLMRFLKIKSCVTGEEVVARFTYEGLPRYCYLCGYLDHSRISCELKGKFDPKKPIDELPYGSWMHEIVPRPEIFGDVDFKVPGHMMGNCFELRKTLNAQKMKLSVLSVTGQKKTYELWGSEFIYHLKLRVEDEEELPVYKQRLICRGKILENSRTLAHYNIQEKETIHLVWRLDEGGCTG